MDKQLLTSQLEQLLLVLLIRAQTASNLPLPYFDALQAA
jgi:hypothetical protein